MSISSRNRDTGRKDTFSDESPKKDYSDYRKQFPNDSKKPRAEKKADPARHSGPKSFEQKKQELISHIQNYMETFSWPEKKIWRSKYDLLLRAIGQ